MLFPFTGVPALLASLKASRLSRAGDIEAAREQGERARDWCWYSLGYGLLVLQQLAQLVRLLDAPLTSGESNHV